MFLNFDFSCEGFLLELEFSVVNLTKCCGHRRATYIARSCFHMHLLSLRCNEISLFEILLTLSDTLVISKEVNQFLGVTGFCKVL